MSITSTDPVRMPRIEIEAPTRKVRTERVLLFRVGARSFRSRFDARRFGAVKHNPEKDAVEGNETSQKQY